MMQVPWHKWPFKASPSFVADIARKVVEYEKAVGIT